MLSRPQKPALRDFLLMHGQIRTHLCTDQEIFDPCEQLSQLTSFERLRSCDGQQIRLLIEV
jgi:hypothetical protein